MNDLNKIIIVGLGETAEMAWEYFSADSKYEVVAFAAEQKYIQKRAIRALMNIPIVPIENLEKECPPNKFKAFIALSYEKMNCVRAHFYNVIKDKGYGMVSYISSKTSIGANVRIGENCFIMENNIIQRNVSIGDDVILGAGSNISHRTVVGNHVFLSADVAVAGYCKIGDYSFLGINSCIGDGVNVGESCYIGEGVAIMRDTKPNEIYRIKQPEPERLSAKIVFGCM